MKKNNVLFELYRYQILPRERHFQGELFGYKNIRELLSDKNNILHSKLCKLKAIKARKDICKCVHEKEDFFLFKYAVSRSLKRETPEFKKEKLDTWPSFLVGVWNEPQRQLIAVQQRKDAFQHSDTPVKLIIDTLNAQLKDEQLRVHYEPLFHEEDFWKIIRKYKDKVQNIEFELVTPNLARISDGVSDDLKDFAKATNTSVTKLALAADPDSSLNVTRDNPAIVGLVRYASAGGGNISIRAKGIKRKIHTSRTVKNIAIDDLAIDATTAEEIVEILKAYLS